MSQIFDENGKVIPVTVIEAGPCTVVQKKTCLLYTSYPGVEKSYAIQAGREVRVMVKPEQVSEDLSLIHI